jgi:hypothetical protein
MLKENSGPLFISKAKELPGKESNCSRELVFVEMTGLDGRVIDELEKRVPFITSEKFHNGTQAVRRTTLVLIHYEGKDVCYH